MLEFISRDGQAYVAALLSTDSSSESPNPDRTHPARKLLMFRLELGV